MAQQHALTSMSLRRERIALRPHSLKSVQPKPTKSTPPEELKMIFLQAGSNRAQIVAQQVCRLDILPLVEGFGLLEQEPTGRFQNWLIAVGLQLLRFLGSGKLQRPASRLVEPAEEAQQGLGPELLTNPQQPSA